MKSKPFLSIGLAAVLLAAASPARAGGPGTTGADLLKVNLGARANALGGAYAAVGGDVLALLYDPATLTTLNAPDAAFLHILAMEEVGYEVLGYAQPVGGLGTAAATVVWRHMPSIDNPGAPDAPVDANEAVLTLGLGRRLKDLWPALGAPFDGLSVGVAVKGLYLSLREAHAFSAAADAGVYWTSPAAWPVGLSLAGAVQHFGMPVKFIASSDPLPLTGRAALAIFPLRTGPHQALVTAEWTFPVDNTPKTLVGAEYGLYETVFLRLGYTFAGKENLGGPAAGLGVALTAGRLRTRLDYTYRPTMWNGWDSVSSNHLIALGASF
jgi:hypothetical protein